MELSMYGLRLSARRTCNTVWRRRQEVRSIGCCACSQFSIKAVPSVVKLNADKNESSTLRCTNEGQLLSRVAATEDVCDPCKDSSVDSERLVNTTVKQSCTNTSEQRSACDHQSVTLCYRPSQQVFDLDLRSKKELSVYIRHREELVTLRVSERFKQLVEEVQIENSEKEVKKQSIESIDDLLPQQHSKLDYHSLYSYYLRLSKIRLTGLVVSTAVAGYIIAPGAFNVLTFTMCGIGTALISASANTINQYLEVEYDAQMNRTKNRPLVMQQIGKTHALVFAGVTGLAGTALLTAGVNPLTAGLGVINLVLYTAVYTPLKRRSIVNTWVGSVVGAIPPMMGWAASCGTIDAGALLLGAIMYAWQFPHFCALSWNLRGDYRRAGYRMMSVSHPDLCRRVSLRYSVGMLALCTAAPYLEVTTWWFAADSLPVNAYLIYLAWKFYRDGDSGSSRKLFHFTLIHIPAIMVLMLISKNRKRQDEDTNKLIYEEKNIIDKPASLTAH